MVNIFIFHAVFVFDTDVCVFDAVVCVHVIIALVVVVVIVVFIFVFAFAVVTFEVIVFSVRRWCLEMHLHVRRAGGARLKRFPIILGKDHCQSFKDGEDVENCENDDGFA